MPALASGRHERFAQELAKGKSQEEAYAAAGYRPSRSAASRLASDVNICARVAEIADRVAIRTEITAAALTDELLAILKTAKLGDTAGHLNAARQSVMDIAKLNGLIIDRAQIDASITDVSAEPEQSEAEWVAQHGHA